MYEETNLQLLMAPSRSTILSTFLTLSLLRNLWYHKSEQGTMYRDQCLKVLAGKISIRVIGKYSMNYRFDLKSNSSY